MKLTGEQKDIIKSTGDIRINAVAGSGKTTTIIEYACARPAGSQILYLAFNKSVKLEAIRKFSEKGLKNVQVETAHSLAYKHIVFKHAYKVRNQSYRSHELVELLGLKSNGEKHVEYIIANHVNKFVTYFCNSCTMRVQDLNYRDIVADKKAKAFVDSFYPEIEKQTRLLLSKMDVGEIDITHDFYLKKFQLSNPKLHYDYILFDEGQDASPAMLDIVMKQKATKVIVGDTHQQIYGWRHAINSLEKADFKTYHLSNSFRFNHDIAKLAMDVLKWKKHLQRNHIISINGKGDAKPGKSKAVIARTNLGLLLKAIEYVTEKRKVKKIYFEGNISSYTYAEEGASLYDVLNLYNGKHRLIRDKLISRMRSIYELNDYIEKTEDAQLAMMVGIVMEYGNAIPGIIRAIKQKHLEHDDKSEAEMIFSTVHRCKGMEYDAIHLVEDFITEEKLEDILRNQKEHANLEKLNEEINLLYVAVTRVRNTLYIPKSLLPLEFQPAPGIRMLKDKPKERTTDSFIPKGIAKKPAVSDSQKGKPKDTKKTSVAEDLRKRHKAANRPWTQELDDELTIMFCEGESLNAMARHFGRTKGAIMSRIKKLELRELYGS